MNIEYVSDNAVFREPLQDREQMSCPKQLAVPPTQYRCRCPGGFFAIIAGLSLGSASAGETGLVLAQFSDCQWAVDRYNSALSDVSYAVSRYASCVGSSRGFDDCSMEFLRLKNAQSDFDQAIMAYRFDCD